VPHGGASPEGGGRSRIEPLVTFTRERRIEGVKRKQKKGYRRGALNGTRAAYATWWCLPIGWSGKPSIAAYGLCKRTRGKKKKKKETK